MGSNIDSKHCKRSKTVQTKSGKCKANLESYEQGHLRYFITIETPPVLFIEVQNITESCVYLDVRNLVVFLIYESFHFHKWVSLCPVLNKNTVKSSCVKLSCSVLQHFSGIINGSTSQLTGKSMKYMIDIESRNRKHPSVSVGEKKMVICGLSSVLRFLFNFVGCTINKQQPKSVSENNLQCMLKQLLGFRGGCLQACAESSIWTKFCEVEVVNVLKEINMITEVVRRRHEELQDVEGLKLLLPETLMRLEHHLSLPVKVHNFRKIVQNNTKLEQSVVPNSSTGNELITDLKHDFAEGPTMLLSDLILYPCVSVWLKYLGQNTFERFFPITLAWYNRVQTHFPISMGFDICSDDDNNSTIRMDILNLKWTSSDIAFQSLYPRDTSRYKPALRQFTRQHEIDEVLHFLRSKNILPLEIHQEVPTFEWTNIPTLAHPEGGDLPLMRQQRKCDQLASLSYHALRVYSKKQKQSNFDSSKRFRIIDFCSGGGHLGILVAWLLPECDVVLVENKGDSLRRAQERIAGLGLTNVYCYQSNLDYFEAHFDLGMALHACGTATDLVIAKCVSAKASFVCCPCCYGSIQENHILSYPRSSIFQDVKMPLRYYFILSHSADQTHDAANEKTEQGKHCMTLIDTDRCLYASESGYDVKLCKIVPENASPKNHILVGISS